MTKKINTDSNIELPLRCTFCYRRTPNFIQFKMLPPFVLLLSLLFLLLNPKHLLPFAFERRK